MSTFPSWFRICPLEQVDTKTVPGHQTVLSTKILVLPTLASHPGPHLLNHHMNPITPLLLLAGRIVPSYIFCRVCQGTELRLFARRR
jgi:hypothetical protein